MDILYNLQNENRQMNKLIGYYEKKIRDNMNGRKINELK